MECNEYQGLISAYVDGMTSPQEEKQLKQHLKVCPECNNNYQAMVQMTKVCAQIEEVELPNDFHQSLMKQIKDEQKRERHTVLKWQYVGTLVATLLVVGLFMNQLNSFKQNSHLQTRRIQDEGLDNPKTMIKEEGLVETSIDRDESLNDIVDYSVQVIKEQEIELEIQVKDKTSFGIALESFLNQQQMTYEKIELGYRMTEAIGRQQLMTWIENHSQCTWQQSDEEKILECDVLAITIC